MRRTRANSVVLEGREHCLRLTGRVCGAWEDALGLASREFSLRLAVGQAGPGLCRGLGGKGTLSEASLLEEHGQGQLCRLVGQEAQAKICRWDLRVLGGSTGGGWGVQSEDCWQDTQGWGQCCKLGGWGAQFETHWWDAWCPGPLQWAGWRGIHSESHRSPHVWRMVSWCPWVCS